MKYKIALIKEDIRMTDSKHPYSKSNDLRFYIADFQQGS